MIAAETSRTRGEAEEFRALDYFARLGWKLLHRNYRCRAGEIDLIMRDNKNRVVFIEVKYRSTTRYGTGQASINREKKNRIVKTALFYIKEYRLKGSDFSFDIAAISPMEIRHIPNAFSMQGWTL